MPHVPENQQHSLRGQLLVASSQIGDPRFQKTVILITEDDESGTLGLIVNKPAGKVGIGELLRRLPQPLPQEDTEISIFYGGPVEIGHVFLLHSTDVPLESSRTIVEGVALSTDAETLSLIARGEGPGEYLLLLGYAGWRPRQLERELNSGSWITTEADSALVFTEKPENTWKRIMEGHRL